MRAAQVVVRLLIWILLNWRTVELFDCDYTNRLNASTGTLLSEVNRASYQKPTSCVWEINVQFGWRIQLDIQIFHIETSCCSCTTDFVEFRDGLNASSPLIGRFCAKKRPERIYSSGNTLRVRYLSSVRSQVKNLSSVNKFRANYRSICGRIFRNRTGELISPGYPLYSKATRCLFTIIVPFGWVKITFTVFIVSLRNQHTYMEKCEKDFVVLSSEVSSVEFKDTTQKHKLCGRLKSPYFFSTRKRRLSLLYESATGSRFSAKFEAISDSQAKCGGLLTQDAGYIYSYGYPRQYPAKTTCTWKIEVLHSYIELRFLFFNFSVATSTKCTKGRVEIFDGWSSSSVQIRTICGFLKIKIITSRTNRLLIRAISAGNTRSTGMFHLSYKMVERGFCHHDEFSCIYSRQCISRIAVCDGTNNCSDGSDELNCPKDKQKKAWYALWAAVVLVAMILMGFWIWRTWKKAVRHNIVIQLEDCPPCTRTEDEECSELHQSGAPPSYTEVFQQGVRPSNLPTYEEAIGDEDAGRVLLENGNVRFINSQNSCNHNLLPSGHVTQNMHQSRILTTA